MAEIQEGIARIATLIKREDAHRMYDDGLIVVFRPSKGGRVKDSFYRLKDGMYDQYDLLKRYEVMDNAEKQLGVRCIYDYTKVMELENVPGITSDRDYAPQYAHRNTNVYYFHTETREKKLVSDFYTDESGNYLSRTRSEKGLSAFPPGSG